MREVCGDLLAYPADALVVPCNWTRKGDGTAVMGAGVALQAARMWPDVPRRLGVIIAALRTPSVVRLAVPGGPALVCYPTKHCWRDPSTPALIADGLGRLVGMAGISGWQTVALPRLGCGYGGLSWATDVRPILARRLDDRFVVVSPPGAS